MVCRKCICNKLSEEELERCPICKIDLGCVPEEKLRRKESSLSSLVVNTPQVSPKTALTGKRSKATARKSLRSSSFSIQKQVKKEEDYGKVANRSKSSKSTSQEPASIAEPANGSKTKGLSIRTKRKTKDKKNSTGLHPPESAKSENLLSSQKKTDTSGKSNISLQAVLDSNITRHDRRLNPVWCSLVASKDLEDYRSLPQIPASSLRIKDEGTSVSFIQKYLMRKLDIPSEDEVEIRCRGEPVIPTLQLYKLIELWLQTISTSEKISATIGSSAEEFVIVLGYARRPASA
ncbi:hypothetical protein AgCh_006051 [Apium graveolens]